MQGESGTKTNFIRRSDAQRQLAFACECKVTEYISYIANPNVSYAFHIVPQNT